MVDDFVLFYEGSIIIMLIDSINLLILLTAYNLTYYLTKNYL